MNGHQNAKRRANLESWAKYGRDWRAARRLQDPVDYKLSQLLSDARKRAKQHNLPIDIDLPYLRSILTETCPAFGIRFAFNNKSVLPDSPTIDKFRPELGYVKGNVTIISHKANLLKNCGSVAEHMALTNWLLKREIELGCSNLVLFPAKAA